MAVSSPMYIVPRLPKNYTSFRDKDLLPTIQNFLSGQFDTTASQFQNFWDAFNVEGNKSTKKLIEDILSTQGAQGIKGGAAGRQLQDTLLDKQQKENLSRQEMILNMINTNIANRQFGVNAGMGELQNQRNWDMQSTQMANAWNMQDFGIRSQNRQFDQQNANTLKNWMPAISGAVSGLASIASPFMFASAMQKFGGLSSFNSPLRMNPYTGSAAKYSSAMPGSYYGGGNV